jgi:hypothetical protein
MNPLDSFLFSGTPAAVLFNATLLLVLIPALAAWLLLWFGLQSGKG